MLSLHCKPLEFFLQRWNVGEEEKARLQAWLEPLVTMQPLTEETKAGFAVENASLFVREENVVNGRLRARSACASFLCSDCAKISQSTSRSFRRKMDSMLSTSGSRRRMIHLLIC